MNFPLILTLGVSQLRLSVAEAFVAATVNGAAALGMADSIGQLARGFAADIALFDVRDHREIPYWYGDRPVRGDLGAGASRPPAFGVLRLARQRGPQTGPERVPESEALPAPAKSPKQLSQRGFGG